MLNIISNKNFIINDSLHGSDSFQFTTHGKFKIYLGVALAIIILLPIFDYLTDLPGERDKRTPGQIAHDQYEAAVLSRAETRVKEKNFEGAKRVVEKALSTWKEDHGNDLEGQERAYLVLGRVAVNEEEWEEALNYYNKSLTLSNELQKLSSTRGSPSDPPAMTRALNNLASMRSKEWLKHNLKCHDAIADLYYERSQFDKAVKERQAAVTFLEKNLKKPDYLVIEVLEELAKAYRDANLYDSEKKTKARIKTAREALKSR